MRSDGGNVGRGWPVHVSSSSTGKREGSHDCGGSDPIYRLEGLEVKQMSSGGGQTGPEALGGEVVAVGAALRLAGRRGKRPSVLGHVCA